MIMNSRNNFRGLICVASLLVVAGTASANLIVNGDFELGNVGFASGYEYTAAPGGLGTGGEGGGAGKYGVGTSANFFHSAFTTVGDHTTGSGNMMVVNGSLMAGKTVWAGTVTPLMIGTTYQFSAWVMNVYPDSPAHLQFSFGGNTLGSPIIPTGNGVWQQFTANFVATINQSSGLIDLNVDSFGNDFALDDISLTALSDGNATAVPDGGLTVALLGLALVGVAGLRRKLAA